MFTSSETEQRSLSSSCFTVTWLTHFGFLVLNQTESDQPNWKRHLDQKKEWMTHSLRTTTTMMLFKHSLWCKRGRQELCSSRPISYKFPLNRRGGGGDFFLVSLTHDSYLFYNRLIFAQPWTLPARTCAEANLPPPTCVFPFLYFALPHFLLTFQLWLSTGTSNESKLHSTEKNNLLHL